MINRLYAVVNNQQKDFEYNPTNGYFRPQNGVWRSLNQTVLHIVGTISVAGGSNRNGYAVFCCSNCAKPIQTVRSRGIRGLNNGNGANIQALYVPFNRITPLSDGVCWHGGPSC